MTTAFVFLGETIPLTIYCKEEQLLENMPSTGKCENMFMLK